MVAYRCTARGTGEFAEATVFQTGSNQWQQYDVWPPTRSRAKALYFGAGGKLSFDPPRSSEANAFDTMSPIRHIRFPYRQRRSVRRTQEAAGRRGWSKINDL
jgi:predicted acyl esterase